MNRRLYRLGEFTADHPWRVIATWAVLLIAAIGLAGAFGEGPRDNYHVPGTQSQAGTDLLTERMPGISGATARVVVHFDDVLTPAPLASLRTELETLPHVSQVAPAELSPDGGTAMIWVQYDVPVTDLPDGVTDLERAIAPSEAAGFHVELGGELPENISAPSGVAEAAGVLAALVILAVGFGSVVAAGLPIAVALVGLGVGTSAIALVGALTDISSTAPTIASMVGIGVGIDYALLLLTRVVEGLRAGSPVRAAVAGATATAGTSVLFAGSTVLVALLGLRLATLPTYSSFGYATLCTVLAVMLTAVTLVPALCALAGPRVLRKSHRRALAAGVVVESGSVGDTATARWAARVGRRPLAWGLIALTAMLVLAAPVLQMRTWPGDAGSQPESSTTRQAYDLVAEGFGPGANGPLTVVVDLEKVPAVVVEGLPEQLRATEGVATVQPLVTDASARLATFAVTPTTAPQDEATTELVRRIRAELPDGGYVTGVTATFADISERLAERLWVVIAFVVAVSVLLLTVVFRAPVVALKAAAMNLLSVSAAYGVMVMVFQWGLDTPVSSWAPIIMFTVLFGLSMDYEVFLLSRVRENWLATGDAHGSVVHGLAVTGRVITTAAAIMVAVFVGFALDPDITVKQLGVGMAVAVLLDATLVRMILVPSTMTLLGSANWWLPAWADRFLPHLDVEGSATPTSAPAKELSRMA